MAKPPVPDLTDSHPTGAAPGRRRSGRMLLPLGLVVTLIGVNGAFTLPLLPLFLSTSVHADPVHTAIFFFLAPMSALVAATAIGRLSDRPGMRRRLLLLAALAGLAGYAVYAITRDYAVLLATVMTLVALSASAFPQSFAFARELLDRDGSTRVPAAISTLRMLVSIAWVAGPPAAAFLLGVLDFTGLFLVVAAGYGLAALVIVVGVAEPPGPGDRGTAGAPDTGRAAGPTVLLVAAAFLSMQCAAVLNTLTLPLHVTNNLRGSVQQAGWILALCAVLEIPLMLVFGALSARIDLRRLVTIGAGFGVAYFVAASLASSGWHLVVAQLLNAGFIAAIAGLGISYFQNLRPGYPGRATTVFANTQRMSGMLAGPILGVAQHFGYRTAYRLGAVLCTVGLLILLSARARTGRRRKA